MVIELKGHSQLCDSAGLDTSFSHFEKSLPQPEIKVHLEIHFIFRSVWLDFQSFTEKTCFWVSFRSSYDIIFYHDIAGWNQYLLRLCYMHSRSQRPRSFWSAPRIATSGPVQRHSVFEWLWKHNRLRPEPIRFVRLDSEHAQSDGKSVNCGLPVLDMARGRDFLVLTKRSAASGDENVLYAN